MAIFNFSRAWRRCERTVAGSSPRRSPISSVSHNKLALRDFLTWAMNNGHMPKLSPPPIQRRQGDSSMTQHKRLTLLRKIPTPVPEPFAGLLLAAASQRQNMSTATNPSSRYLFPGRRAGQPINPYTLYPAMRELGIPTQTARTSAIRQLVLQAPAPVIAHALGYHPTTAHKHAADAGGTWIRYAPGNHERSQPRSRAENTDDLSAGLPPAPHPCLMHHRTRVMHSAAIRSSSLERSKLAHNTRDAPTDKGARSQINGSSLAAASISTRSPGPMPCICATPTATAPYRA
jgi:hypothetical protein